MHQGLCFDAQKSALTINNHKAHFNNIQLFEKPQSYATTKTLQVSYGHWAQEIRRIHSDGEELIGTTESGIALGADIWASLVLFLT